MDESIACGEDRGVGDGEMAFLSFCSWPFKLFILLKCTVSLFLYVAFVLIAQNALFNLT